MAIWNKMNVILNFIHLQKMETIKIIAILQSQLTANIILMVQLKENFLNILLKKIFR